MKKQKFFNSSINSLFRVLCWLAIMLVGGCGFCIYVWFAGTNPDTHTLVFFAFPIFAIGVFVGVFLLWAVMQFVEIDEDKIIWKRLKNEIGMLKWQDVKEVKIKVSASDKTPQEIVFVSKIVDFAIKDKPKDMGDIDEITLKYSKNREQFLKQLKPDLQFIIEEDKTDEITEEK